MCTMQKLTMIYWAEFLKNKIKRKARTNRKGGPPWMTDTEPDDKRQHQSRASSPALKPSSSAVCPSADSRVQSRIRFANLSLRIFRESLEDHRLHNLQTPVDAEFSIGFVVSFEGAWLRWRLQCSRTSSEEDGAMGKCPNHKNSHGKHYSHKSARRTKFEKKDILATYFVICLQFSCILFGFFTWIRIRGVSICLIPRLFLFLSW